MWFVYALGSAVFAALTSILAKIGIEGVNSTLATAIRKDAEKRSNPTIKGVHHDLWYYGRYAR